MFIESIRSKYFHGKFELLSCVWYQTCAITTKFINCPTTFLLWAFSIIDLHTELNFLRSILLQFLDANSIHLWISGAANYFLKGKGFEEYQGLGAAQGQSPWKNVCLVKERVFWSFLGIYELSSNLFLG